MGLIAIEYPERRFNFFKEQLAAAKRRLDWSLKHNPDWNDNAEKGEVVSFYEWAVKMAEAEADAEKTSDNKASDKKQATSEWISVKERLPEAGEEVLICDARDAFLGMFFLEERKSDKVYFWHDGDGWRLTSDEVTHWMPLPSAPKDVGKT